jgi:hypothetical protein
VPADRRDARAGTRHAHVRNLPARGECQSGWPRSWCCRKPSSNGDEGTGVRPPRDDAFGARRRARLLLRGSARNVDVGLSASGLARGTVGGTLHI